MPEPVRTGVDFLSGDYSPQDSVNTARLEARYLDQQGMPWDLMAWSFSGVSGQNGYTTKPLVQLQQEAAIVMSQGGGFQAYVQQRRDGSVVPWMIGRLAELGRFCRARQAVCHRSRSVPQIGLILPTAWFYHRRDRLFSWWPEFLRPLQGILIALLNGQKAVDVVSEHHLCGRLDAYPLLVLPETDHLTPSFRRELLGYVRRGGRLLIVGPRATALFRDELGVRRAGTTEIRTRWLEHGGALAGLKTLCQTVSLRSGVRTFGRLHAQNDITDSPEPAASVAALGRGRIAAVYFNFGEGYVNAATTVARDFLNGLADELFPDLIVRVTGSHHVDVALRRKDGRLIVNLINTAGPHADGKIFTHDDIPAVGPLTVRIRVRRRPRRVMQEPGHRKLPFRFRRGRIKIAVPRLAIHTALAVD